MNRLFESKWVLVSGIAALFILGCLIFAYGTVIPDKGTAPESGFAPQEQVVTFSEDVGGKQGRGRLERAINEWLKKNEGKIEVTGRTQSGDSVTAIVMIWYKTK